MVPRKGALAVISIAVTYRDSGDALKFSLRNLACLYEDMKIDLVIVDDGSVEVPLEENMLSDVPCRWDVNVHKEPQREAPLDVCWTINKAVSMCMNEIVLLHQPDVTHSCPWISEGVKIMNSERANNPFLFTKCISPDDRPWYIVSADENIDNIPPLSAMMFKNDFYKIGGYDEIYRSGYGWSDIDFNQRMIQNCFKFILIKNVASFHHTDMSGGRPHYMQPDELNGRIFSERWKRLLRPVIFPTRIVHENAHLCNERYGLKP
jgi:hypothetical protein